MSCNICGTTDEQAEWRPVKAWEDRYLVSSDGRVYTKRGRKVMKLRQKTYLEVGLTDGSIVNMSVHLLVASAFIGSRPSDNYECNHKDGVKYHNCVSNLEWLTRSENQTHARRIGLFKTGYHARENSRGSKNNAAILTEDQVLEIRKRWQETKNHSLKYKKALASEFGVRVGTIQNVVYRYRWTHI